MKDNESLLVVTSQQDVGWGGEPQILLWVYGGHYTNGVFECSVICRLYTWNQNDPSIEWSLGLLLEGLRWTTSWKPWNDLYFKFFILGFLFLEPILKLVSFHSKYLREDLWVFPSKKHLEISTPKIEDKQVPGIGFINWVELMSRYITLPCQKEAPTNIARNSPKKKSMNFSHIFCLAVHNQLPAVTKPSRSFHFDGSVSLLLLGGSSQLVSGLITMVIVSPLRIGLDWTPSKWPSPSWLK